MKTLDTNWLTEGLIDSEYKRYVLLAWLQHCREKFGETKLYPPMAELVDHYRRTLDLKKNMELFQQQFPKDMVGFDFNNLKVEYDSMFSSDEQMNVIAEIIEFALPQLKSTLNEGKEIYDLVELNMEIQPIGLMPVYTSEGYLLVSESNASDVFVYQYQHSVISTTADTLRSLTVQYVYKETQSLGNTIETIKLNLAKKFLHLPNPATWLCKSKLRFPLNETLLPVAKRALLRCLSV